MSIIYVSFDTETNGLVPGIHSMISLGAVAFTREGREVSSFQVNIEPLADLEEDHNTMQWWMERPNEVYTASWENQIPAGSQGLEPAAIPLWLQWLNGLLTDGGELVGITDSKEFDLGFLRYYLHRCAPNEPDPLARRVVDLGDFVAGMQHELAPMRKRDYPAHWWDDIPEDPHIAVRDARNHAMLVCNMWGVEYKR